MTDEEKLCEAAAQMERALQFLDQTDAPADIGAHLDLAICRLRDFISTPAEAVSQVRSQKS